MLQKRSLKTKNKRSNKTLSYNTIVIKGVISMKYTGSGAEVVFESQPSQNADEVKISISDLKKAVPEIRKVVRKYHKEYKSILPMSRARRKIHARDTAHYDVRIRNGIFDVGFGFKKERSIRDAWYMRVVDTGHFWYVLREKKVIYKGKVEGQRFTEKWGEKNADKMSDEIAKTIVFSLEKQGFGNLFKQ